MTRRESGVVSEWLAGGVVLRRWWWLVLSWVAAGVVVAVIVVSVAATRCGTSGSTIGCADPALSPAPGVSVVTGVGRLTGVTRTRFETPLHEFEIRQVKVLAGPDRPSVLRAWLASVPSPGPDLAPAQVPGLWAPDGRVLAYVGRNPEMIAESSTALVRPIVHGDVVFSAAGCGSAPAGLQTVRFDGPLAEVPNSRSYRVAQCNGGFSAAPLEELRRRLE